MQITKRNIGLTVDDRLMRVYVAAPKPPGQYPGILFYSDIYQLGRPITLLADRLAGYGYVVAAPEIFHRLEPIGTVIQPDDLGRLRGNEDARQTGVSEFDADACAVLDWLTTESLVDPAKLGALGFCIGGHLALRAALQRELKATVCCYPTGVHNGKLGREIADTQQRFREIRGELLIVFGSLDPHVPEEGRSTVIQALETASTAHRILIYEADHTFMRDDGYRYDPLATDAAWTEIVAFLNQAFLSGKGKD
ncbi:MAG: dienelactone hydrolase family protein [Kovacikia sp.]